jgi:hypothetical protein
MNDDYLFEKRGPPDPEVERLEKLLARYRFDPAADPRSAPAAGAESAEPHAAHEPSYRDRSAPLPGLESPALRWLSAGGIAIAAAVMVAVAIGLWDPDSSGSGGGYRLIGVAGRDRVRAGEEIVTAEGTVATLEIGWLGRVELQPRSRLRVEPAAGDDHRFYLDRGSLHAKIFAQARRFQIGTPAGRSIDLGCEYSLDVGDDGVSRLRVLTGQVAFEFDGREVYVPAGATCVSFLVRGPSAPVFDDADAEFKRALAEVESSAMPSAAARARVLACDQEEALSVWHLFDSVKTSLDLRQSAYERLSKLFPKPQGVTEEGLLRGDRAMRESWLETMKPWWRRQ